MRKHTGHRWLIGAFLAACLMVVTGAAFASSTTSSSWPARCTTMACVNRHMNAMHVGNVIRSGRIATLQTQMAANGAYHKLNTAQHAAYAKELTGYDATIAALTSKVAAMNKTVAGYDAQIAALNDQVTALKGDVAVLKAWKADVKAALTHVDVTVDATTGAVTFPHGAGLPTSYMLLFEKPGTSPPPIFP